MAGTGVFVGLVVIGLGALEAFRPSFVAETSRWVKAWGTESAPSDIQMTETNIFLGRLAGVIGMVIGLMIILIETGSAGV